MISPLKIFTLLFCLSCYVNLLPTTAIQVRTVQEEDFEAVKALGLKALILAYNLTDKEQIEALRISYDATLDEDKKQIQSDKGIIALVAVCRDTVVGYLSANMTKIPFQAYGRTLMVDPSFQHQGVSTLLVKHCMALLPPFISAVCFTSRLNLKAQKFYEYLGGRKVENATWSNYLYSNLNLADFVGYEFGQQTLKKFQ
jgi:GNAT superfamily N-acetyltransferase